MQITHSLKKSFFKASLIFLAMGYFYAFLSPNHYAMFSSNFNAGLEITVFYSIAICLGLKSVQIEKIGFSTLSWFSLAVIILIQPLVNHIYYPDALIFPFGLLLISGLLSIFASNVSVEQRIDIIKYSAWVVLVVGLLNVVTQLIQLFYPNTFDFIAPTVERLHGNIAQPNQASVISVFAVTAGFYLSYLNQKNIKIQLILAMSLVLLVAGISLTISRTGLILLFITIFGALFYSWQSHKYRLAFLILTCVLSMIGYKVGLWLMQAFFTEYYQGSGIERLSTGIVHLRQLLLERAFLGFSESPIFGIGYDNFMAYGFDNIEKWSVFEPADHAHNLIAQLAVEFGLVGLLTISGVVIVLIQQLVLFFRKSLSAHDLFLCLLLLSFVAYSFSEYPLWYPAFLLPFVFFVGLLDKGFSFSSINFKKILLILSICSTVIVTSYTAFYHYYLEEYEIVMFVKTDNQQKIDAYQRFPNIFGFRKTKEYMLHMVVDPEKPENADNLIVLGERLIKATGSMDITRVQIALLMMKGRQDEADMLNRRVCIWEYQYNQKCDVAMQKILTIDPEDKMGYAKRLNDWYLQRYGKE